MKRNLLFGFVLLFCSCQPESSSNPGYADTAEGEVIDTFSVHRPKPLSEQEQQEIANGRNEVDSIINGANSLLINRSDTFRVITREEAIISDPDVAASFPGGDAAMKNYFLKHLVYPLVAFQNEIKGTVWLKIVIEKDGRISAVKVQKGLGYGCDESAVDCVKQMPVWTPALKAGIAVRCSAILPITFGN